MSVIARVVTSLFIYFAVLLIAGYLIVRTVFIKVIGESGILDKPCWQGRTWSEVWLMFDVAFIALGLILMIVVISLIVKYLKNKRKIVKSSYNKDVKKSQKIRKN